MHGGHHVTATPIPPAKPAYCKSWLSYSDQVALLQKRGLIVADSAVAAAFLSHVNYYRFSGYCLAFESARHTFVPGTTFEQIQASYEFDRMLRDLITEALEVIELDVRTRVAHHFGQAHGPFGHTNPAKFYRDFDHPGWIAKLHEEAERSRDLFVKHYRATYAGFPDMPIWIATEVMSFGALSQMFKGMLRPDQKAVATSYGRQPKDLVSWLHHMVYVRNLCAHHSRLWDRIWSIKPDIPPGKDWSPPLLNGNNRLFATLLILCCMLGKCPTMSVFTDDWRKRVEDLLAKPPTAPNAAALLGLSTNWNSHPCWV